MMIDEWWCIRDSKRQKGYCGEAGVKWWRYFEFLIGRRKEYLQLGRSFSGCCLVPCFFYYWWRFIGSGVSLNVQLETPYRGIGWVNIFGWKEHMVWKKWKKNLKSKLLFWSSDSATSIFKELMVWKKRKKNLKSKMWFWSSDSDASIFKEHMVWKRKKKKKISNQRFGFHIFKKLFSFKNQF